MKSATTNPTDLTAPTHPNPLINRFRELLTKLQAPKTLEVDSTAIAKLCYHKRRMALEVEFKNGSHYEYGSVPFSSYRALVHADSKGSFFNKHIRNDFPMRKLDEKEWSF